MKTSQILLILALALLLVASTAKVSEAGPMGTAFTYQGRLTDANEAADGIYDFNFGLYDSASDGERAANDVNVADVDVIDGYFTVELDFGAGVFDGDARWLGIGVRPGDMNDPNAYTTLSPRQAIMPTPYALYAGGGGDNDWTISGNDMYSTVPGNVGIGIASPSAKLEVRSTRDATDPGLKVSRYLPLPDIGHTRMEIDSDSIDTYRYHFPAQTFGATLGLNSNSGGNVILAGGGGNVGIRTSNPLSKLSVGADGFAGVAVYGSGSTYGLYGSSSSVGVHGVDTDTGSYGQLGSGDYGVYGSGSTHGMYGSGSTVGVWGEDSDNGSHGRLGFATYGVYGSGSSAGVWGEDSDTSSYGYLGYGDYGVYGSGSMHGVYGIGTTFGVEGKDSDSNSYGRLGYGARGVHGYGTSTGVYGQPSSSSGDGVVGYTAGEGCGVVGTADDNGDVTNYGGKFRADGNTGRGVYGECWGSEGYGVRGMGHVGVYGGSIYSSGIGVSGESLGDDGYGVKAINSGLNGTGLYATGGVNGYAAEFDGDVLIRTGGRLITPVLEITGADLAEQFPFSEPAEAGMVVAIDEGSTGKLSLARGAYNRRVAGIVAGANEFSTGLVLGKDGEDDALKLPVALTGRVYCRADASNGPIEPGDLLTTSDMAGHAMKVTDYTRAQGAILGKAMSSLDEGRGLVLVLVTLQ